MIQPGNLAVAAKAGQADRGKCGPAVIYDGPLATDPAVSETQVIQRLLAATPSQTKDRRHPAAPRRPITRVQAADGPAWRRGACTGEGFVASLPGWREHRRCFPAGRRTRPAATFMVRVPPGEIGVVCDAKKSSPAHIDHRPAAGLRHPAEPFSDLAHAALESAGHGAGPLAILPGRVPFPPEPCRAPPGPRRGVLGCVHALAHSAELGVSACLSEAWAWVSRR